MKISKKKIQQEAFVVETLSSCTKEDEVRLIVSNSLGISLFLKLIGRTDGYWNGILFEFKYNKKFRGGPVWNRTAYQVLAQAIYYCRKIVEFELDGVAQLPHTIVCCDKNGAFLIKTDKISLFLSLNTDNFDYSLKKNQDELRLLLGNDFLGKIESYRFSWLNPPSLQEEGLVNMIEDSNFLEEIVYYDFEKAGHFQNFLDTVKYSEGDIPKIPITINNFIPIFNQWFKLFGKIEESKRVWADKYINDLRRNYKLSKKDGSLVFQNDTFYVPTEIYEDFWSLYIRPPEDAVDKFIATNKDLLFDEDDQNNHGDFYTPIKVANMAQQLIHKYLDKKKTKVWWDPAAGGGNLFFKFTGDDQILLTTKFDNDVEGLKDNTSVSSSKILKLDFISELLEKENSSKWKEIQGLLKNADEIVFFMNPPFDDQAESRGENESVGENFLDKCDVGLIDKRSMRSMHVRFLYRILSLSRALNKKVWVAAFSKSGWVVGPDFSSFYKVWESNFKFKDGFIISSKVFNGVKEEWPCLFSFWEYNPAAINKSEFKLNTFDKNYNFIGAKTLIAFDSSKVRLSSLCKLDKNLKKTLTWVDAVPLENEYCVARTVYEDKLPVGALGYIRCVANDVYNSAQGVQITSSVYGPSNHNGAPILESNFEIALFVYGIRKCVRKNWINDKDELYFPLERKKDHNDLIRSAALYTLLDGGYSSSMKGLVYKRANYEFRNQFFICSPMEIRNWGARDCEFQPSYASKWLRSNTSQFSVNEIKTIKAAKKLIELSFKNNNRAKGDVNRELNRGDAGFRQLINGLLNFEGAKISEDLQIAFKNYLELKEVLRKEIEVKIFDLKILMPFESEQSTLMDKSIGDVANKLLKTSFKKIRDDIKRKKANA